MINDLISKRAVLELAHDLKISMIDHNGEEYTYSHRCIDPHAILDLPAVRSGRDKGKWDNINYYPFGASICCSQCKHEYEKEQVFSVQGNEKLFNFCPHCGADMRGKKGLRFYLMSAVATFADAPNHSTSTTFIRVTETASEAKNTAAGCISAPNTTTSGVSLYTSTTILI